MYWPPFPAQYQEVQQREVGGYLDESFLSEVSAQMRQVIYTSLSTGVVIINTLPVFDEITCHQKGLMK